MQQSIWTLYTHIFHKRKRRLWPTTKVTYSTTKQISDRRKTGSGVTPKPLSSAVATGHPVFRNTALRGIKVHGIELFISRVHLFDPQVLRSGHSLTRFRFRFLCRALWCCNVWLTTGVNHGVINILNQNCVATCFLIEVCRQRAL
jgi:hypothetical protein